MDSLMMPTTTRGAMRTWHHQKKTILLGFKNCGSGVLPSADMTSNDRNPLDYRLEEVINRYSAQTSWPRDEIQDGSPNVISNKESACIADEVTRMPDDNDPPLWRVRVHVSLSLFLVFFWPLTR
jgi:hypothetical protein